MASRNSLKVNKKNGNVLPVAEQFAFTTKHVMIADKPEIR